MFFADGNPPDCPLETDRVTSSLAPSASRLTDQMSRLAQTRVPPIAKSPDAYDPAPLGVA
jgi:hypothetical protein